MNSSSTIFIQSVRQCLTYQAFCRRIVGLGEGADVSSGWISKGFCYCCLGYNFMEHMAQLNSLNQLSPFTITYLFLVLPSSFGRLFFIYSPKIQNNKLYLEMWAFREVFSALNEILEMFFDVLQNFIGLNICTACQKSYIYCCHVLAEM